MQWEGRCREGMTWIHIFILYNLQANRELLGIDKSWVCMFIGRLKYFCVDQMTTKFE